MQCQSHACQGCVHMNSIDGLYHTWAILTNQIAAFMRYNESEIPAWCKHKRIAEQNETLSDKDLNNHLSSFTLEANRQDGALYPPDVLFQHLRSE